MVLPPIERTPVLVMQFTDKASPRLIDLATKRLEEGGLIVLPSSSDRKIISLTSTQDSLESQAERIHLLKRTIDSRTIEYFTVQHRERFCHLLSSEDKNPIAPRDQYGLFTSNEWSLLVFRILDGITVLPEITNPNSSGPASPSNATELSRVLDQEYRADYFTHNERINKKLRLHGEQSSVCLWHVLRTYGLVDIVTPLHLPRLKQDILDQLFQSWKPLPDHLIHAIQDYYGWEIAFYFALMGFLTQWLLFPGVLGAIVFAFRWYRNDTIETDEYTPFYGLVTFVWGILFLRFWQREEHRLAFNWGTYSLSPYERQKFFAVRPEFRGYLRVSPITGLVETYYPAVRRQMKYVVSTLVTLFMLAIAFVVMICSLNLQGYINPKADPKRWMSNPHPFYVASLGRLSEEGALFDAKSQYNCYIPVVLHATSIFILNSIYRVVAGKLTEWENHETELNHRNSLILKRFLFEATDCYLALFYLAFYERDVDRLRMELIAVFQIDTIRRILLECLVPMLLQRLSHRKTRIEEKTDQRRPLLQESLSFIGIKGLPLGPTQDSILDDLEKDDYEQFDDFMEIIIQVGYTTLFASAYPLASLVSILANWIEIRSDCMKLTRICRRPKSFRCSGLGVWKDLMAVVLWTSALTNCLIAGFTSGQLQYFVPDFYSVEQDLWSEETRVLMRKDKDWLVVFLIFGLERIMIVVGLLIFVSVPAIPEDVTDDLERGQYLRFLAEIDGNKHFNTPRQSKKDD